MGVTKEHRPLQAQHGLQVNTASTFTANLVLSTGGRLVDHVQSLTGASTGTQITNYGITTISSTGNGTAANLVYTIAAPIAGVQKLLLVNNGSTKTVQIRTLTSAAVFYGTTKNAISWSTGSTELPGAVGLIGISTSQWAITSLGSMATTAAADREVTILGATA